MCIPIVKQKKRKVESMDKPKAESMDKPTIEWLPALKLDDSPKINYELMAFKIKRNHFSLSMDLIKDHSL